LTTTAANQIDLPQHLEDQQIFDLPWRGWSALPPAKVMGNLPEGTQGLREGSALEGRRGEQGNHGARGGALTARAAEN